MMKKLSGKVRILTLLILAIVILSVAGCEEYNHHHRGRRWYNWDYYHRHHHGDRDHAQDHNHHHDGDRRHDRDRDHD